ncbi:hypothetical protein ATO4_24527 [Aurantimonas sp. 22II-16-19i]|nr:hypothetical protein ATO4_24527 [Aurantimonas sp. 22II-16-19i]
MTLLHPIRDKAAGRIAQGGQALEPVGDRRGKHRFGVTHASVPQGQTDDDGGIAVRRSGWSCRAGRGVNRIEVGQRQAC